MKNEQLLDSAYTARYNNTGIKSISMIEKKGAIENESSSHL